MDEVELIIEENSSKSSIWKYYTKERINNKLVAKCNSCRNIRYALNGDATTNLWNHIKKFHKNLLGLTTDQRTIDECINNKDKVNIIYINVFLKINIYINIYCQIIFI